MANTAERRGSRRFTMALPLTVRFHGPSEALEQQAKTRDVSFRGLYFLAKSALPLGAQIEFVLTLPREITLANDVHIRCFGEVVRVETQEDGSGIAARIERYEFLPSTVS